MRFLCLSIFFGSLLPLPVAAQYTTGRVQGVVFDPANAVVSGAAVTLTNTETGLTRTFETSGDGVYFFAAVPPGPYRISVSHPGFAEAFAQFGVYISQTVTQNLTMTVAQNTTSLSVTAEANSQLNSFDPLRSVTSNETELLSLPNVSRSIVPLVTLAPGVQPTFSPRGGSLVTLSGAQAGQIAANGSRAKSTSHQLDYTDANDWEFGGIALGTQPTPEMMQEFKVLTSDWSAEYGVKSGAEVLMVTRSGANQFHGVAHDYLQNSALNSRDYFDRTGSATPLRQNLYGVDLGGPVIHDRTFFFAGYEGEQTGGAGNTVIATVPTAAARASATDPAIRTLMNQYLPLPAAPTSDPGIGAVTSQLTSPSTMNMVLARGDHYLNRRHTLTVRYFQNVRSAYDRLANTLPGFDATFHPEGQNAMVAETWVMDPETVNEFRAAYGRSSALFTPENNPATPRFVINGLVSFGTVNYWPQGRVFNVYQLNDVVTRVRGRHILKAGFDLRKIQDNSLDDTSRRGVYTFTSLDTFLAGEPASYTQVFGNTYRGFRMNVHGFFLQDDWKITPTVTLNLGLRAEYQGGMSEVNGPMSVLDPATPGSVGVAGPGPLGTFRNTNPLVAGHAFLPGPRFGFAWNPREGSFVIRGGYGIYWDSYLFNGLGAGRTTPPTNYTGTLTGSQISGANSFAALLAGTAPYQQALAAQLGSFGALANFGGIVSIDPHLRNPYSQQFSFGVERRLTGSVVADVSYVGTKGTALAVYGPANSLANAPAPATSLADEQARLSQFQAAVALENGPGNTRLDPRFDQVDLIRSGGSSIFHSMQVEVRKSLSHGLMVRASYTWSKSIDNSSDYTPAQAMTDAGYAQDQYNLGAERAVSSFDIPQRLILSHVWQIPAFHAQKGLAGRALGGWSFSSINQLQSGIPATILAGPRLGILDVNMDGNGVQSGDNTRASCVAGGNGFTFGDPSTIPALNQRGIDGAPNSSNFLYVQPLLGNNGACGRNTFRMNPLVNFDWSFTKDIRLSEGGWRGSGPLALEFTADLFNIFNVPFLTATGNDWRTVSSAQFGLYNAAGATRRVQLALRLVW